MADALAKPRVSDPHAKDSKPLERQDAGKLVAKSEGSLTNSKITAKLRSPTLPTTQSNDPQSPTQNENVEARGSSEAPIDPLSQQILKRTNTAASIVQKYRVQTGESTGQAPTSPNDTHTDTKYTGETVREIGGGAKADKKKGVSFLSRFISGTKKKGHPDDGGNENGSEAGDQRAEGMDAQLFSHTVDNLGFSPKHPQPPAYIKVRAKFKKEREFNRVFLAQELRSRADRKKSTASEGSASRIQSGAAALHNPIWAAEFSKDGRYLAAGGQDKVVRVWAVISTPEERRAHESNEGESTHLSAPVFQQKPYREYLGHQATILDLSWSKNNFLLSSSMDKTVRLWHLTRIENLCTFKHSDFVPSIQFHPKDDRFFLAGSLDTKLRLWSIPDKSVAYSTQLPDMITSVAFTPDGKTCIAGTLGGHCMFYDIDGLKLQSQIHVKSTRGQNAKGSKITGIQAIYWPPGSETGDIKLLITSNDSRVRLYNCKDKTLEMKFRGHENNCSQIRATFADDTGHVICGSEDRKAYIWSTTTPEGEKKNQRPVELFEAHNSITTCAIIAPLKTRQLLSASEDPIFDLCNPPPVTLISRDESMNGSKPPTEAGSALPTPAESTFRRVAESPAYIARSAHTDGNIIVTADYTGSIKVFRQDCAYTKRNRLTADNWDGASVFSKRASKVGRSNSILSLGRSRRDSTATQPPNERIMNWRQELSHSSFDSVNGPAPRRSMARSTSPRKSKRGSIVSMRPYDSPALGPLATVTTTISGPSGVDSPKTSVSIDRLSVQQSNATSEASTPPRKRKTSTFSDPIKSVDLSRQATLSNPLSVWNGQSWAFWTNSTRRAQVAQRDSLAPQDEGGYRPELRGRASVVSKLTLESGSAEEESGEEECRKCKGTEFKVRVRGLGGKEERLLVCTRCGTAVQ
ncbi:WD40 repeat-like protein [Lentithecium fluviatile CBS 122367]|uniref:WD40 repeat-like protein n=1 Tax=Lentithecium fluviatile CBS 122367 TaxID=1168545 RepID=A0A6G1IDP7_9PLEO|nr:WD40 repeat-like protein [Lentithecium fluviatile CBS 122367]